MNISQPKPKTLKKMCFTWLGSKNVSNYSTTAYLSSHAINHYYQPSYSTDLFTEQLNLAASYS